MIFYTSTNAALAAIREANCLTKDISAYLTLLVLQVVPYPLPLDRPAVSLDISKERLAEIACESAKEINVCLCLCRDRLEAMQQILKPNSLVIVGRRHGYWNWWFAAERRLIREMRRAGHQVFVA